MAAAARRAPARPERPRAAWRRGPALACAVAAALARPAASAAIPSKACSTKLDSMLVDPNWVLLNNSAVRWCRVRLENEMARCCRLADFARGRGEGCTNCAADCQHQPFIDLCNKYFGRACTVKRKPFFKSGAPELVVAESFCLPDTCDNDVDRDLMVLWFGTGYRGQRNGWHLDYDQAVLECESRAVTAIIAIVVSLVGVALAIPCSIFLFKAPRQRGRTLVSQAEMQQGTESEVETMEGSGKPPRDLRKAAQRDDSVGPGM